MNPQIFFSVIIPTHNRRDFLKTALESVLAQTCPNIEVIVVDDGSNDGTGDLMSSFNDERLIYIYHENQGVSYSRNKGLERASGDFIAFLDSDDRWVPEKLLKTIEYIKLYPSISIFHTDEIWYRKGKFLAQKKKHKKPSGYVYTQALPICCISISTAVIKHDLFHDIGCFDEDFEACEDYDFWLRATSKYEVKLIPEELTIKDGGRPDQLSSKIWGLDRFRIMALDKMLSSGTLDKPYFIATLDELKKKCRVFALGAEKHGNIDIARHYLTLPEKFS